MPKCDPRFRPKYTTTRRFRRQSLMGWGHLLCERISTAWSKIVAHHYRTNKMVRTLWDSRWTTRNPVISVVNLKDKQEKALDPLKFGWYKLTQHFWISPVESSSKDPKYNNEHGWKKLQGHPRCMAKSRRSNPIASGPLQTLISDYFMIDRAKSCTSMSRSVWLNGHIDLGKANFKI